MRFEADRPRYSPPGILAVVPQSGVNAWVQGDEGRAMESTAVSASEALRRAMDAVASDALELQYSRTPGLRERLTQSQMEHSLQDTRFHVAFLASALWANEPILFSDYARWTLTLFENLNLPAEWLTDSLECIRDAAANLVEPGLARVIADYIDSALQGLCSTDECASESLIEAGSRHGSLAMRYLGAVIGADRRAASQMILQAVDEGMPVSEVNLEVLQPVQKELGRLWQTNRITVAQEHYATAVTQMVMSQLYAHIFSNQKNGRTMVAACVGGELHEIGMRMVADFFEMRGWDTHYIGANTPVNDIVETVALTRADVLALSVTMGSHVVQISEVIDALRADSRTAGTKVIVGGYPFILAPELWRRVGADGSAGDAAAALELAERLVAA